MKRQSLFTLLLSAALLSGCSYAMEEAGLFTTSGRHPNLGSLQFAEQKVTFEVVKAASLRTCLECHTEGNRSMNTPEKVLALKDNILSTIQKGTMPPRSSGYQPLSSCDRQILETWLDDQTHDRSPSLRVKDLAPCGNTEAPQSKPKTDFSQLEVSFANLSKEILAPKCLSCHTTETAKKTILEDVAHIEAKGLLAEKAEDSVLYQICVPGMNRRFMPPKKSGIPALNADELAYLKKWIESERK